MDVRTAIKTRRSVRNYAARPLPDDVLARLTAALRAAPSACNLQPWHFIFVHDEDLRRALAQASFKQSWMAEAPVIVVACGLPEQAYKHMGGHGNSADIDVAIAVDHLTLAAVAEGLGTCWIGAFDPAAARDILGLPDGVEIVGMTPLGVPDIEPNPRPRSRRPLGETVMKERWG